MSGLWESLTFDEYVALSISDPLLHSRLPRPTGARIEAMFFRWRDLELRRILGREQTPRPQLSVVMPARNMAHTIRRPILSLRQQIDCDIELVLVDDASTDDTIDRAKRLSGSLPLTIVTLKDRRGQAAARNIGIEAASHPVIGFLDADDWWDAAFGLIMTNSLREEGAIPVCTQRILRPAPYRPTYRYGLIAPELLQNRNALSVSAFVAPRELLQEVGGFPEDLATHEDWVLAARLATAMDLHAVPAALSTYDTTTAGSVSKSPSSDNRSALDAARAKVLDSFERYEGNRRHHANDSSRRGGDAPCQCHGMSVTIEVARRFEGRQVTIALVSFEQPDVLRQCLDALAADLAHPWVNLLVIDNGSTDPGVHEILRQAEQHGRTRVIRLAVNGGFSAAVNRAQSEIDSSHDLVLLNNDVIVSPGWLKALRSRAADPRVGLVVPTQFVPTDYEDGKTHVPSAEEIFPVDVTYSSHSRNVTPGDLRRVTDVELRFVPLFCAFIPADVRAIGLPLRGGLHYESDRFFCDVIRHWGGYRIVRAPGAQVLHLTDRSGRALRERRRVHFSSLMGSPLHPRPATRLLTQSLDRKGMG